MSARAASATPLLQVILAYQITGEDFFVWYFYGFSSTVEKPLSPLLWNKKYLNQSIILQIEHTGCPILVASDWDVSVRTAAQAIIMGEV